MFNRAEFWSPIPDWSQALLRGESVTVTPVPVAAAWWVSGDATSFLERHGLSQALGPRDTGDGERYALRYAPGRLLFVSQAPAQDDFGWTTDGGAITDISDGMMVFDIHGEGAAELMAQGGEYPFAAAPGLATESASLRFAGFRLAVMRRPNGWRLHLERPWAPALWHWLQAHVDRGSG